MTAQKTLSQLQFPYKENEILMLIPQRPPFVMVDELVYCDDTHTLCTLNIKNNNIFIENEHFSEVGILENIAQSCAVRLGYLNINQPVKIGMVASISNFELFELPKVDEKISTEIIIDESFMNVIMFKATVKSKNTIIATCNMKVILTDIDIEE
ncbi:hydroxymyristoyl-ACP dehydratase [Odoribacter sp. OttesenSCG-928-L07]|nr:hydroxymyristoyl-ACP dehydratase [Odoribacter sp. OttesenSCG-928-L07]MDL2238892.1 hydroxymyristoyl-ACP dehydratase [Bacteroidales bacterium OttesenSCG-928-L14]MDL2240632.1 hydroxymyristoyl-ACP dehydratase [Bacteroidales bacterium OttesenSCG-928-K22]